MRFNKWFKHNRHLIYGLVVTVIVVGFFGLFSFLIVAIDNENALAKTSNLTPPDDIAVASQTIRGVVDSSLVVAKKATTPQQPEPSKVVTRKPRSSLQVTAQIPILMYHKTPFNFENQLQTILAKGYTPIHMDEVGKILYGEVIGPSKPLVITFDDGFANQLEAFRLLQKYNVKATFYVIIGGQLSEGCIGLERQRHDCGDAYLNWSQIETMSQSDLVEIGSHTFDHPDLTTLSEAELKHQIEQSKDHIEQKINREITTLAYPYGRFNPVVMQIAQAAGYTSAVSTISGIDQSTDLLFALHRVRDTNLLP